MFSPASILRVNDLPSDNASIRSRYDVSVIGLVRLHDDANFIHCVPQGGTQCTTLARSSTIVEVVGLSEVLFQTCGDGEDNVILPSWSGHLYCQGQSCDGIESGRNTDRRPPAKLQARV